MGRGVGKERTVSGLHNEQWEATYWSHVCCGLQTTFMNLPEMHWHTVCLCVFVCSIKTQQQECGSRGDISTTMEHKRNPYWLSELWKVCRFMLTYKQPGDWFAPVWSILAQVRMVVPVAVSLLQLHCMIGSGCSLSLCSHYNVYSTPLCSLPSSHDPFLPAFCLFSSPIPFPPNLPWPHCCSLFIHFTQWSWLTTSSECENQ